MTSQAATTMTMIAKIWPSALPCMREKAISARFAALSISSRQSRMTSGLRRVSTPAAPIVKISALTARYQPMATYASSSSGSAGAALTGSAGRRAVPLRPPTASAIVPVPAGRRTSIAL